MAEPGYSPSWYSIHLLFRWPSRYPQAGGGRGPLRLNPSLPATCFPTAATVANSWDEELAQELGEALGEEAAVQGVNVLLGPGLNIKRSPLCGRNFEYFSEDPYLAGKMAAAYIRGIQKKAFMPALSILRSTARSCAVWP